MVVGEKFFPFASKKIPSKILVQGGQNMPDGVSHGQHRQGSHWYRWCVPYEHDGLYLEVGRKWLFDGSSVLWLLCELALWIVVIAVPTAVGDQEAEVQKGLTVAQEQWLFGVGQHLSSATRSICDDLRPKARQGSHHVGDSAYLQLHKVATI